MKNCTLASALFFLAGLVTPLTTLGRPAQQKTQDQKKEITRVRMGGAAMAKELVHRVAPLYPKEARKKQISGTVRMHLIVGTDGKVQQIEIISGPDLLRNAALDAVRQWEYRPILLNGKPVEADTTVDAVFSLSD